MITHDSLWLDYYICFCRFIRCDMTIRNWFRIFLWYSMMQWIRNILQIMFEIIFYFFCFFKSTKVTHSICQKPFANNVSIFKVGVFISVGVFGGCSITCVNESLFFFFLNNEWFLLKVSINKNWQFGNGHYVMERQMYKGGYTNEL